jgi:hypothetical protein
MSPLWGVLGARDSLPGAAELLGLQFREKTQMAEFRVLMGSILTRFKAG